MLDKDVIMIPLRSCSSCWFKRLIYFDVGSSEVLKCYVYMSNAMVLSWICGILIQLYNFYNSDLHLYCRVELGCYNTFWKYQYYFKDTRSFKKIIIVHTLNTEWTIENFNLYQEFSINYRKFISHILIQFCPRIILELFKNMGC